MIRQLAYLLCVCSLVTACGGRNPYLEASLKPAELQGKDKAWFEKNWGAPTGKASRFFGERLGLTTVLLEGNQARRYSTLSPMSVRSPSSLIKMKSSPTTVILQGVSRNSIRMPSPKLCGAGLS